MMEGQLAKESQGRIWGGGVKVLAGQVIRKDPVLMEVLKGTSGGWRAYLKKH